MGFKFSFLQHVIGWFSSCLIESFSLEQRGLGSGRTFLAPRASPSRPLARASPQTFLPALCLAWPTVPRARAVCRPQAGPARRLAPAARLRGTPWRRPAAGHGRRRAHDAWRARVARCQCKQAAEWRTRVEVGLLCSVRLWFVAQPCRVCAAQGEPVPRAERRRLEAGAGVESGRQPRAVVSQGAVTV